MLASQEFVRFSEKNSHMLFDVTQVEEEVVLVRQVTTSPIEIYLMRIKDFVDLFEEYGGPQPDEYN